MSTLDGPIWSRCSIALTCPARSYFQRTQSRERWTKAGMNVTAHQEKKKKKETKTGKKRAGKRENRRPILRKLCASLLRLFRGKHTEKVKGSAWGNWDPREVQQPFRPNPSRVGDRTTTLRWLLIDAVLVRLLAVFAFVFATTNIAFCLTRISSELKILHAMSSDLRHFSSHSVLHSYAFCAACSLATLFFLYDLQSRHCVVTRSAVPSSYGKNLVAATFEIEPERQ